MKVTPLGYRGRDWILILSLKPPKRQDNVTFLIQGLFGRAVEDLFVTVFGLGMVNRLQEQNASLHSILPF